jgi:hypothetical protein
MKKNRNSLISKYTFFALSPIRALVPALAIALFSSCSCNYHVRRVQNRCPDYLQTDTSFAVRPAERYDTIFLLTPDTVVSTGSTTGAAADTFLIEKERVRVQLVRVRDTIFANVELPPDTVATVQTVTIAAPCPEQGIPRSALPLLLAFTAVVALWVRKKIKG